MSLISLPDIFGMLVLMGVLGWLRKRHRDDSVDLWLLGLFFILVESVAVAVLRGSSQLYEASHVIALDSYLLAGATFGWAARQDLLPGRSHLPFFALPAVPMLLMSTVYGLGVVSLPVYVYTAAASLLLGVAYLAALDASVRLRSVLFVIHGVIWIPTLYLAWQGNLRSVIYWELTCLYLLVAVSFRRRVRKGSIGGVVIVTGFTVWALCFYLHPFVRGGKYEAVVEQVWNLQKFFVILGMLLTLLEDETERRKAEATHDVLTGLPNRRLFNDRLTQAIERSRRSGRSVALFVVDLNGFKQVNDTLGHGEGDRILCAAAESLQAKVRSSDTLARCGGDEFCVIVNELTRRTDCARIAAALCGALEIVETGLPGETRLSGSVGYAVFPQEAANAEELFRLADRQMYERKAGKEDVRSLELAAVLGDQVLARNR